MLTRLRFLVVAVLIFSFRFAGAMVPETTGLYLSFEQRLALTYALLAQGETAERKEDVVARAKSYFKRSVDRGHQVVKVQSFDEFLTSFRGPWPSTHSVALDVEMIEKRDPVGLREFVADSPRVQRKIDEYLVWQEKQLRSQLESDASLDTSRYERLGTQIFELLQSPEGMKTVENLALGETESFLNMRMKELDRVGDKMGRMGFSSAGKDVKEESLKILMQTMLSEYFARLGASSKKLIVSSFLGEDLFMDDMKKFEIMVQNSGPQLQKLLQIMASQSEGDPRMLAIFKMLESSVRPVPWELVQEILESEKKYYKFHYFEKKNLGVGSVAQVHRAKVLEDRQRLDLVVRFIKPGIEDRVAEDHKILAEVAALLDANPKFRETGAPLLSPIVEDITATVKAELKPQDTVTRQKMAKTRYETESMIYVDGYKHRLEVHVPAIYEGANAANSKLMLQEMVLGRKLDKEVAQYAETMPHLKQALVEEIAKIWAREIIFGGGFYHADLHQGNFMVQVADDRIRINILDYGMGGVLSKHLQRQVMLLGVGTEVQSSSLIARAFWNMSEKEGNRISEANFYQAVQARLDEITSGRESRSSLENWTAWAMDAGLKLPYDFINLNRGLVIVNKMLKKGGSPLTVTSLIKILARTHLPQVYHSLVIEEKVSYKDLIKLGWAEFKELMKLDTSLRTHPEIMRCEALFL